MLFFTHTNIKAPKAEIKPLVNNYKLVEDSKESLYQDIFVTLLSYYADKAINDFYRKYLTYLPHEDPWFIRVLSTERIDEGSGFNFLIKLEVVPYIGPHNSVGVDHITFRVQATGEVILEKFEHIKSYSIAPNYQDIIIKWPPK